MNKNVLKRCQEPAWLKYSVAARVQRMCTIRICNIRCSGIAKIKKTTKTSRIKRATKTDFAEKRRLFAIFGRSVNAMSRSMIVWRVCMYCSPAIDCHSKFEIVVENCKRQFNRFALNYAVVFNEFFCRLVKCAQTTALGTHSEWQCHMNVSDCGHGSSVASKHTQTRARKHPKKNWRERKFTIHAALQSVLSVESSRAKRMNENDERNYEKRKNIILIDQFAFRFTRSAHRKNKYRKFVAWIDNDGWWMDVPSIFHNNKWIDK